MERYSDEAIRICNELHTERLDYNSEYLPLIDAVQRLVAYEDTGLEPEAVEHLKLASMGKAIAEIKEFDGLPIDRLRELARADKDGRCVVLPCNVGDTVWRIYDDCVFPGICGKKMRCKGCEYRNLFAEEQAFCLSMLSQNGKLEHPFYTRKEAAEAALEGMKK